MSDRELMTADRTDREAMIRDLYSIVAFYVANPEHPLPDYVTIGHYVDDPAIVDACAYRWNGRPVYGDLPQTDYQLPGTSRDVVMMVRVRAAEEVAP